MDKLAIVILNWNGEEMLKKYLPAVMQYSREEAQIYVADNASTDGSLNLLAQDSRVQHHPTGEELGLCRGL